MQLAKIEFDPGLTSFDVSRSIEPLVELLGEGLLGLKIMVLKTVAVKIEPCQREVCVLQVQFGAVISTRSVSTKNNVGVIVNEAKKSELHLPGFRVVTV